MILILAVGLVSIAVSPPAVAVLIADATSRRETR